MAHASNADNGMQVTSACKDTRDWRQRTGAVPRFRPARAAIRDVATLVLVGVVSFIAGCAKAPMVDMSGVAITLAPGPEDADAAGDVDTVAASIYVTGLPSTQVAALRATGLTEAQWANLLRVTVVMEDGAGDTDLPPVLGSHAVGEDDSLRFTPLFPFDAGRSYAVRLDPNRLPGHDAAAAEAMDTLEAMVALPRPDIQPTTVVERIYPSGDRVPENQLKLYLHFSAPMSHVDGLAYLRLLDRRGREVEAPFLPFGLDFWDRDHLRYTVFFDPGRIKQGLELNELLGRSLQAGETYTLVVDPAWPDAAGNPLQAPFEKRFSVGPADTSPLDHTTWRLRVPAGGSTQRLVVSFPEPLDHALMRRAIGVETDAGESVPGEVETGNWETRWMMTPARPWVPGAYALVASTIVEDLAGNQIGTPFEISALDPTGNAVSARAGPAGAPASHGTLDDTVRIPFDIR